MAPLTHSGRSDTAGAIAAPRALRLTGVVCVLGLGVVSLLGRDHAPTFAAQLALVLMAMLAFGLAKLQERPDGEWNRVARAVGLFAVGVSAAFVGWFFGPQTELNTVIVLGIMILGVASTPGRDRLVWLPAWAGAVGLGGGQLAVTIGLTLGLIPDVGLVPLLYRNAISGTDMVILVANAFVWILFGFLSARRFRTRYHALTLEVDQAARTLAVREALLEEARHEYMRALGAARTGRRRAIVETHPPDAAAISDATPDPQAVWDNLERTVREALATETREAPGAAGDLEAETRPLGARSLGPVPGAPSARDEAAVPVSAARDPGVPPTGWAEAYRGHLVFQQLFVFVGCLLGITFAYFILEDRLALAHAVVGMTAVAALALWHRFLIAKRGKDDLYWPWTVIAGISVVTTSSYGLHSAVNSFIVLVLFISGLFRGGVQASGINRRSASLVALSLSYFVTFLLVWTSVIEDRALVPIRPAGMPFFEPLVHHAILQLTFALAFVISGRVDRDFRALRERVTASANEAAVQQILLATASLKLAQLEAATATGLFAGQRVGRFTLGERRASGGMGEVYDAIDPVSSERVAVKLVRVDVVSDPTMLEQFAHEVAALRRVQSPFVARVLDAGGLEAGLPYVAMELIEGPALGDLLREKLVLSGDELRALMRDVSLGLSAVHRAGVVHRDVKPQNLLRATQHADAPWKIVDLGIAHIEGMQQNAKPRIAGTPRYMAPEQFTHGEVDGRADLYALSLVLYRALTGRPAFVSERMGKDGRFLTPLRPSGLAPMAADLELCLRIGTATRPDDRFATAESLFEAFTAALDGQLSESMRARATELLTREPWSKDEPATDPVRALRDRVTR